MILSGCKADYEIRWGLSQSHHQVFLWIRPLCKHTWSLWECLYRKSWLAGLVALMTSKIVACRSHAPDGKNPQFRVYSNIDLIFLHSTTPPLSPPQVDSTLNTSRNSATRFSTSCFFFHESVSPNPLSTPLGLFRIFSNIRGDIRSSRCTTGVVGNLKKN